MSVSAAQEMTIQTIRRILRRDLKLGETVELPDDMPLIGGELDLDSLDVLLMLTSLEKEFGFKITSETIDRSAFATLQTLAQYVDRRRAEADGGADERPAVNLAGLLGGLPHRDPFRFITDLLEVMPGAQGRALWRVHGAEPFFAGHFPGHPLVPGVLIGEALAQLSGLVGASKNGPGEGRLASIQLRFRETVAPPAEIELISRAAGGVGSLMQFEVEARVGGRVVADGSLALSLQGS